ncbi:hypothetical protein GOBAR_AA04362 [Gossypium barbadense]|uniref:Uncharacterized protein n=1 Tax=Gossypium barbadense TaxID=3634 RepID=A0A2P5YKV7_GOSBA|nr:hypothetical protein GOBAR_AA04362 [Gossypium barbadense]
MAWAGNNSSPLVNNRQTPCSTSNGSQQEAQILDNHVVDPIKDSNAMLNSMPNVEDNSRTLIAGQKQLEPKFSLYKQTDHVVHFNPTFEENSFANVEVKGVLEAKNHSAVVFSNKWPLEAVVEESGGSQPAGSFLNKRAADLITSEIDRESEKDLSIHLGEEVEYSSSDSQ